jgi:hypothetical protein
VLLLIDQMNPFSMQNESPSVVHTPGNSLCCQHSEVLVTRRYPRSVKNLCAAFDATLQQKEFTHPYVISQLLEVHAREAEQHVLALAAAEERVAAAQAAEAAAAEAATQAEEAAKSSCTGARARALNIEYIFFLLTFFH